MHKYSFALVLMFFMAVFSGCGDSGSSNSPEEDVLTSSSSDNSEESSPSKNDLNKSSGNDGASSSSLSSSGESSSSEMEKTAWQYLNPNYSYGEIIDERDGQRYKTTIVNSIQEWFSENLNYADSAKTPSLLGKSWCYENSADSCSKYGRLYAWGAAIDSAELAAKGITCGYSIDCDLPSKWQGICPDGWRLPSEDDWDVLFSSTVRQTAVWDFDSLMSIGGWEEPGSDFYGFSALPSGLHYDSTVAFFVGGSQFYAWGVSNPESESGGQSDAYHVNGFISALPSGNLWIDSGSERKKVGYAIRCMRDLVPVAEQGEVLKDSRNGQTYKTVKIGTQIWMAENLNYADSTSTPSLIGKSWCYDNDEENCEKFGRLYTWAAVIDSVALEAEGLTCGYKKVCRMPEKVQGICPDGWHVPSEKEMTALWRLAGGYAAGDALKGKDLWNGKKGEDVFGFDILPGGYRYGSFSGGFDDINEVASLWSSSHLCDEEPAEGVYCNYAYYMVFSDAEKKMATHYSSVSYYEKRDARSLRCVKD